MTTKQEMMQNSSIVDLDGFAGYTRAVEGQDDSAASGRVLQGDKIRFIDPRWLDPSDKDITGMLLTSLGLRRVVNKWGHNNKLLVTRILGPNEKYPDFKKLNSECPKSEWLEKFGQLVGPWSGQHVLYFLDAKYNCFCWPSQLSTIGSAICVEEFVDQVNRVRRIKGQDVYAVTELSRTDFPTSYGLKQRPYLMKIKDWVRLNPNQPIDPLPAPDQGEITSSMASGAPPDAQFVTPPTAKEELKDSIPF
jgi:hypothetical protein